MNNEHFDIKPDVTETQDKPIKHIPYVFDEPIIFKRKPEKSSGFKSLGTIIKIIAFFVALAVIAIHTFAAYFLFAFRPLYASICIAIVTLGLVLGLIVLFLIYALGHNINQNNEILDLLKKDDK